MIEVANIVAMSVRRSILLLFKNLVRYGDSSGRARPQSHVPQVPAMNSSREMLIVSGPNGSGKTTSIAKLANMFKQQGKSVVLGAGDTFRAAAVEQLTIWADRLGVEIVTGKPGVDPASGQRELLINPCQRRERSCRLIEIV